MISVDELLQDTIDNLLDEVALIEEARIKGMDSMDFLIEKEKRETIAEVLRVCMPILDYKDQILLLSYCINRNSLRSVSYELGNNHRATRERFDRLYKKLKDHLSPEQIELWKDQLAAPQSELEAGGPTTAGWPMDMLRFCSKEGAWGIREGRRVWCTKWECKIPEYLRKAFPKHPNIKCTICDDACTRKTDN